MTHQTLGMSNSKETRPSYRPPGDYRFDVALSGALKRHDFACAACEHDLDGDGVHRHLWYNDHSERSGVPLCLDCANSDDWREQVRENRLNDAGRLRGRVIEMLWPYSTTQIRFGTHLLAAAVALVTLTIAVVLGGYTGTVITAMTTYPLGSAGVAAVAYLGQHALWVRRDPRGYAPPTWRTPWHTLVVTTTVGGLALTTRLIVSDPRIHAVATGVAALALLATAYEFGLVVRADRADTITAVPRDIVVGGTRALTLIGLVDLVTGGWLGTVQAALPLVVAAAYLVYRAPRDSTLQRRLATARDELRDLIHGGPY